MIRTLMQPKFMKKLNWCCLIRELPTVIPLRQQPRQKPRNSRLQGQPIHRTAAPMYRSRHHPVRTATRMMMPQLKRPHMMWQSKNRHRMAVMFMYGQTEALRKKWLTPAEAILRASRTAILLIWKSLPKMAIPLRRLQLTAAR